MTINNTKRHFPRWMGTYARKGCKWSGKERAHLIQSGKQGKTLRQIASEHGRDIEQVIEYFRKSSHTFNRWYTTKGIGVDEDFQYIWRDSLASASDAKIFLDKCKLGASLSQLAKEFSEGTIDGKFIAKAVASVDSTFAAYLKDNKGKIRYDTSLSYIWKNPKTSKVKPVVDLRSVSAFRLGVVCFIFGYVLSLITRINLL